MLVTIPLLPVAFQVQARDTCRWDVAREQLQDTIELCLIALPLGRLLMTLRPERGQSAGQTNL